MIFEIDIFLQNIAHNAFIFQEHVFAWNVLQQKIITIINRVTTKRLCHQILLITTLIEQAKEMQKKVDHLHHHAHPSY